MKRQNQLIFIFLLTIFFLGSCNREEDDDHFAWISIENFSDLHLDSLKISSSTHYYPLEDPIVFYDLEPGSMTGLEEAKNFEIKLYFWAYIEGDSIFENWTYPGYTIDPSDILYLPNRQFNFAIIECDTVDMSMIVGLTAMYNEM